MKVELTLKVANPDVVVLMYEGAKMPLGLPADAGKALTELAAKEAFTGKDKELVLLYPCGGQPGRRVFLTGLGARRKCTVETVRQRIAAVVRRAKETKSTALDVMLPGPKELPLDLPAAVQAMTEAALLTSYRFDKYKAAPKEVVPELGAVNLVLSEKRLLTDRLRKVVSDAEAVCAGVAFSRNLTNEPANVKTPEQIGKWASELAKPGRITVKVYHKADIEKLGMGGLLAVAAGSDQPPVFVHLTCQPKGAKKSIVLIGKGITFDSGGLNIKTGTYMNNMKDDMSGGAAVLGLFSVLRTIDLPVTVHGLIPLTENMSGGSAMKVGDVFKAYGGKTVEVLNTDAEGRLILADALAYGAALKPDLMIDMATLTGACVVALGLQITGVLGTAARPIQKLIQLGHETGENFWELPLFEGYRDWNKSRIADLNNTGKAGQAGTIFAGLFLQEFVAEVPWIHLDIAGTAMVEPGDEKGYLIAGGTGVPIRTLLALFSSYR
jgi:leucyl aminopeptidase